MYLIRGKQNIDLFLKRHTEVDLIATIGNFDGLHLGHQHIINNMEKDATDNNWKKLVIFTEPHAKEFFAESLGTEEEKPPRIFPWSEKVSKLTELGVEFAFFLNFNNFFPEFSNPRIISMFSGFNYGVIVQDSIIALGLDFYLGDKSIFYQRLNDPEYLKYQKQLKFLVPNVMEAWYDSFFSHTNKNVNFLSQLIYKGKIMFLLSNTMPDISMDRLLRYSISDLSWCKKSAASIWAFLIENDILFSTKQKDYRTYLNHAPFSKGMPQDSPSRIAYYLSLIHI